MTKNAEKPEPKTEPKTDKRGDPHDRIDALIETMRANGWTVKG